MKNFFLFASALITLAFATSCKDDAQIKPDTPVNVPELKVTTTGQQLVVEAQAVSDARIDYALINPVEGGKVTVSLQDENVDWITNIRVEEFTTSGHVYVDIAANDLFEDRNTVVTLVYTYDENEEPCKAYVNIIQDCQEYDYEFLEGEGGCNYYGEYLVDGSGTGLYQYELWFDNEAYDFGYDIMLVSSVAATDLLPVPGTYEITEGRVSDGCISEAVVRDYSVGGKVLITRGQLVIDRDGDTFTVNATLYDVNNAIHRIDFTGPLSVKDKTKLSDFTEDIIVGADDYEFTARIFCNGTYFTDAAAMWDMFIEPKNPKVGSPYIRLGLFTDPALTKETGLGMNQVFELKKVLDDFSDGLPNVAIAGYKTASNLESGCWFMTIAGISENATYLGSPIGALQTGTITVNQSDSQNMILSIDAMTDNNKRLIISDIAIEIQ